MLAIRRRLVRPVYLDDASFGEARLDAILTAVRRTTEAKRFRKAALLEENLHTGMMIAADRKNVPLGWRCSTAVGRTARGFTGQLLRDE